MNGWVPDLEGPLIPYPQHILDLLEPRLATDAVAVLDREAALTYRQLGAASAGIAAALRGRGVATGEAVIVHARNSRWAVVGMLGVLRAGARYVPVDAAFPIQRQHHLAAASGARIAVVEPDLPMPLGRFDTVTVDGRHPVGATTRGPLAYTCYTSGSTGLPKGVTISAAALAYSTAARLAYYPRPVTTFLLSSSISFDSSVAGIYWTLASGGTLVIPSDRTTDLVALGRAAHRHAASHLLMVPSLYGIALRGGLAGQLRSLSTVVVAGEVCPPEVVRAHLVALPETRLYNEYGPTECTVWCTVHACGEVDAASTSVPIGAPIPGTAVFVRDRAGGPVPSEMIGELYVSGPGLAVSVDGSPFVTVDGRRLYRTGDLVSVRPDGELAIHGRVDGQLKLGGVRVERAEIERALLAAPGVLAAAVGVAGRPGRQRVVGFVVPANREVDRRALRAHLLTLLPAGALPARVHLITELPLLPNGKVDHATLDRMTG